MFYSCHMQTLMTEWCGSNGLASRQWNITDQIGKPVSPSARFEKTHLLDLYASARFSDMLVRCFITAWRNARCQSGQRTTVFGPWTSNGMSPAAWLLRCQAPKCFRAQFLCLLNRAAMAEATRRYRTQVLRLRSATTCFGRRSASTTVYGAVAY